LFTKTRKEAPSDEVSKNAQLLIRGGYIHKEMAGVYSYLPLGLRVLNRYLQLFVRRWMLSEDRSFLCRRFRILVSGKKLIDGMMK